MDELASMLKLTTPEIIEELYKSVRELEKMEKLEKQ